MLISPASLCERVADYYANGLPKGVSTGWMAVDEFYTVKRGEFTIVTGIPGHGKSEWLDALMVNLAVKHDFHFANFSPENHPIELHCAKLMEKYCGKPFDRGPTDRMGSEESLEALEWANKHFRFILPEAEQLSLAHILDQAKDAHRFSKPMGIVIDPWNELDHRRPEGLTETEYISQSLSMVRSYAREFNTHVWLVAHPTKLLRDKDGKYPVPTPYDISGSAHWRNKADNCITLWRDVAENSQNVEVHIQKVRFKQVGKIGLAKLLYDRVTGRYFERNLTAVRGYQPEAPI